MLNQKNIFDLGKYLDVEFGFQTGAIGLLLPQYLQILPTCHFPSPTQRKPLGLELFSSLIIYPIFHLGQCLDILPKDDDNSVWWVPALKGTVYWCLRTSRGFLFTYFQTHSQDCQVLKIANGPSPHQLYQNASSSIVQRVALPRPERYWHENPKFESQFDVSSVLCSVVLVQIPFLKFSASNSLTFPFLPDFSPLGLETKSLGMS